MKLYPAIILVLASAPAQAAPDELLDWHWAPTLCIARRACWCVYLRVLRRSEREPSLFASTS